MVRNGLSAPKNHTVDTIWKTWISSRTVPDTTVWQQGLDQFHIRSTDLKRASIWPQFEVKVKFPVLNQLYRSNYIPNIFPKSHPSDEPLNTKETEGILCFLHRQKDSQQNVETFYLRSTDLKGASICPQFEVKVKFPVLNQLYRSNYMPNIFPKKPSHKVCYCKKWLSEEILVSKDSTRWALSFEPITKPYIRQINEIINGSSLGWL